MTFLELAARRQSVRAYLDKPVAREKLARCLEAARLAPSASNSQPWRFVVADEPSLKDAVADETFSKLVSFNSFVPQAPVLVLVMAERPGLLMQIGGALKRKPLHLFDVGIACEHFCLQAAEEGLGTCMLGWFNERRIKKIVGLPRGRRLVLLICVGYPREDAVRVKKRKPLEELVRYNNHISN